ncbi:MAG: carboxylating nicotinate-nucleotide diphosphorylase [Candidatus Dadabacteria bacterium]|nr:MAG: carboxylating nicotinate-nucleotide diphosphorylase [Candidatus Dadabacteria bacterium]
MGADLARDPGVKALLELAVGEDLGQGDVTSLATVPEGLSAQAMIVARQPCVVAGLVLFEPLAAALAARGRSEEEAASLSMSWSVGDGAQVPAGARVCQLEGTARALLAIERTFLNFLGRLSGIATLTARFVERAGRARILDTRKTTPGHRVLEKYAVRCGGGSNHRFGLFDAILIKDNHVAAAGGLLAAIERARAAGRPIEVECENIEQVREAVEAGVATILLDNFSPADVEKAVALVGGRARVEVSGGVDLDTVGLYAAAGADDISVGRLTHSAPAIDMSMRLETRP